MDNHQRLRCMEVCVCVADSGSFSAAARVLGTSQPSVSRYITLLENDIGLRIFQRTTRKLSLTEAGSLYLQTIRKLIHDVENAYESISGFNEEASGVLRIGAPLLWAELKIAPHLAEFLQLYPKVTIELLCADAHQDLVDDQLDLVIRVGVMQDSSYVASPLGKVRMVLCASPQYLAQYSHPTIPSHLAEHSCLVYGAMHEWCFEARSIKNTTTLVQSSQQKVIQSVDGKLRTNSVSVLLSALQQHLGVTLIPEPLVRDLLATGQLVELMPDYKKSLKHLGVEDAFALYSNRKHLAAKTKVFLAFIKRKFQQ